MNSRKMKNTRKRYSTGPYDPLFTYQKELNRTNKNPTISHLAVTGFFLIRPIQKNNTNAKMDMILAMISLIPSARMMFRRSVMIETIVPRRLQIMIKRCSIVKSESEPISRLKSEEILYCMLFSCISKTDQSRYFFRSENKSPADIGLAIYSSHPASIHFSSSLCIARAVCAITGISG